MQIRPYRQRYKKLRPLLFWALLLCAFIVAGIYIYKDLTAPLPTHTAISITNDTPPQTEPPMAEAKANHKVPPQNPKYLIIPKLSVNTNVQAMSVTTQGAIDAPKTAWDVGWYQDSTLPGAGSGAALIDGHVNDAFNTPGVFSELSNLNGGDDVMIIRGDDSKLTYKVVDTASQPLGAIDMKRVLSSADPSKEGLNLITCGGRYDKTTKTYSDRIVVFTVRVS